MTSPAFATLEEEIQQVCFVERGYPEGWPAHERCPCCDGDHSEYTFSKHGLAHSICRRCQFVFMNPYPDEALLDRIYNASYYPAVRKYVELPKARRGANAALFATPDEILDRFIEATSIDFQAPGTWLDVGGGLGCFAARVRQRLPGWAVCLNDMNKEALAFAQEVYGLRTLAGGPAEMAALGDLAVVSLIQCLEHVPQPYDLLSALALLLRPGGYLMISVPRFSPLCRVAAKDGNASVAPPYHVSHFDENNLRVLLDRVPGLDADPLLWQQGPPAFKLLDMVPTWPYWRVEVPTEEIDAPRIGMIAPYPPEMERCVNALAAADSQISDLITRADGKLYLQAIARRVA